MNNMRTKSLFIAIPLISGFTIFYVVPYAYVFYYSFFGENNSVNLNNIIVVSNNIYFRLAISNTALFILISMPILIVLSYLLAHLIIKNNNRIFRLLLFLPILVPSASIATLCKQIFESFAPFVKSFLPVHIYILFVWKNIGLICLIIIGGLTRIPNEIYEASVIDGANIFQKHKNITLPLLSPILFFCFLISIIQSFKIFREVYIIYGSHPPENLYMIQNFIFNKFNKLDYSELSAGTIIFTGMILLFFVSLGLIGYFMFIRKRG